MTDTVWPAELFRDLDRTGPIPLHFQVSSRLEDAIRSGAIPAGARLANELLISDSLGLSRPTVRRAIQTVVDKGLLVRRRGIGTMVVPNQVRRSVELTSLYEDLARSGEHPKTEVLEHGVIAAPADVAQRLGVDVGAEVLHLRRLRSTGSTPIAVMENWLPADFGDITAEQLRSHGLYQALRERGIGIRVADQRIGARDADREERQLLALSGGSALLTIERVSYDSGGRAVEFGRHCYRPDRYVFETTLVAR